MNTGVEREPARRRSRKLPAVDNERKESYACIVVNPIKTASFIQIAFLILLFDELYFIRNRQGKKWKMFQLRNHL